MTRRKGRAGTVVGRYLLGQPIDGRRHSDATFWRRGTKRVGTPPYLITWEWWNLAAGWQRAAVRLVAGAIVIAALALTTAAMW